MEELKQVSLGGLEAVIGRPASLKTFLTRLSAMAPSEGGIETELMRVNALT